MSYKGREKKISDVFKMISFAPRLFAYKTCASKRNKDTYSPESYNRRRLTFNSVSTATLHTSDKHVSHQAIEMQQLRPTRKHRVVGRAQVV